MCVSRFYSNSRVMMGRQQERDERRVTSVREWSSSCRHLVQMDVVDGVIALYPYVDEVLYSTLSYSGV